MRTWLLVMCVGASLVGCKKKDGSGDQAGSAAAKAAEGASPCGAADYKDPKLGFCIGLGADGKVDSTSDDENFPSVSFAANKGDYKVTLHKNDDKLQPQYEYLQSIKTAPVEAKGDLPGGGKFVLVNDGGNHKFQSMTTTRDGHLLDCQVAYSSIDEAAGKANIELCKTLRPL